MVTAAEAGLQLRALRAAQQWTQRDVSLKSNGILTNQQISRIERGEIDEPPMRDLVLYGQLLGMSPNQVAALYGYWDASTTETRQARDNPLIITARDMLQTLPPRGQRALLRWLKAAIEFAQEEAQAEEAAS